MQTLYTLTTLDGAECTSTGTMTGRFAMTKAEVIARIGDEDPSEFKVYELVPILRQLVTKLEIV